MAQYREAKVAVAEEISTYAAGEAGRGVTIALHGADVEEEGSVYLTLTGTSAECGDDGATGRGNRITGLITSYRPTSLEAVVGKNAVSHVRKLYNVLALHVAREVALF